MGSLPQTPSPEIGSYLYPPEIGTYLYPTVKDGVWAMADMELGFTTVWSLEGQVRQFGPADILGNVFNLEVRMWHLESAYDNYNKYMIKFLLLFVTIQAGVLATVFSAQLQTDGCEIWRWCPLILSVLASSAMTVLFLQYFVQQLGLLNTGRRLQHQRNLLVQMLFRSWGIRLFSTYGIRTVFQEATNCWWTGQRVAFLHIFIAFSLCLMLACTRLLC